jgi:hypothetical protein
MTMWYTLVTLFVVLGSVSSGLAENRGWCDYRDEAPAESSMRANLPRWVCHFAGQHALQEQYEPSFRLNPFFLLGDFDGDHQTDAAILIRNVASGQIGIAVIHRNSTHAIVLGAGRSVGNGGADFAWMDNWTLYPKGTLKQSPWEKHGAQLHGDALWVAKSESASAFLYWNGRDYAWYQESD